MATPGTVYIVTNRPRGVLYTGVTSDLAARIDEHVASPRGFAGRYNCDRLVWFEEHGSIADAIQREKRIKAWRRDWKIALVEEDNPDWEELDVP